MKTFLSRVPLPISGLMLGLASMGRLFAGIGGPLAAGVSGVSVAIAALLWMLVALKFALAPRSAIAGFNDPVVCSVLPNFTMATMVLATFLPPSGFWHLLAGGLWWLAVVGQYGIMGWFIVQHVVKPRKRLAMVLPSWFVLFVGIGVIPVTSPAFAPALGVPTTWLSLALYACVFPLVIARLLRVPLPRPALPLTTILAAPASLCLAAYMTVMPRPNAAVAGGLMIFSQLLYVIALVRVAPYFFHEFAPSFGAFTFPLAITATAITKYNAVFAGDSQWLLTLQWAESAVIAVVCAVVAVRYARFLWACWPQADGKTAR